MSNEVEEIKQKLDLAEIIGSYIPVLRAGGANMKARCPFHQEKTPSFYISRDRQMWHCFGCGEGGDLFTFIMKMEGLDFRDALALLAERAGVKLPNYKPEEVSERRRVLDALTLAARFYAALLESAHEAAPAREYLAKRGVDAAMIQTFGLGFAPAEWDSLTRALGRRGVVPLDLEKAGLALRSERGRGHYDRFRGRIMFPIRDPNGQTIGFTGRVLDPEAKEAKYVNTPQTLAYNKSTALYGIDEARGAIRAADLAVIVEGNMDVVACHQIGEKNTVAASGTALTAEQLRLLGRYTQNLAIAFDADSAGAAAARRGIGLAIEQGFNVRVIRIPENGGKDPDDCIKKDPALWRQAVAKAEHYMDYLIAVIAGGQDLNDPATAGKVGGELLVEVERIPDALEKSRWLGRLASLFNTSEAVLREKLAKLGVKKSSGPKAAGAATEPTKNQAKSRYQLLSESFLALVFAKPELAKSVISALPAEALDGPDLQTLYKQAVGEYTKHGNFQPPPLSAAAAARPEFAQLCRELLLLGERDYAGLPALEAEAELRTLTRALRESWKTRRLEGLAKQMREAEAKGDLEKVSKLEQAVREIMLSQD
ncbi:MAG: DNA primase [Candidatus Woesebacteria bacterium]|nr:DNA primase [Candidatus Woesebacteria bacterium]